MESGRVPEARPATALAAARPKVERFGRYYLLECIGKGGMAEVFRAVTLGLEGFRRMFVVKRILAEKSKSPEFLQMFCDEARISALLHHPNVVQVYDFGHEGGSYFLVMEYLHGRIFSSVMRVLRASKLAMPPTLAAFVAQQAAAGLHYAHALRTANGQPLGIVHRDVTPSNIMLLKTGGVKILDFGVAKATALVDGPMRRKSGGFLKGKLGYVSPEQARSDEVDARSDIFSLGVTLWEMLAGKRLFAGANELETLSNVLQKTVPPPSTVRPGVPPELDAVVMRAVDRDRARRYQGADEMASDLEQIVRDGRYETHSLQRLLDELFGEESSSTSDDLLDVPPELAGPTVDSASPAAPTTQTPPAPPEMLEVPRTPTSAPRAVGASPSFDIEIAEASAPRASRTRSLAPPFGVAATSDIVLPTAPPATARTRGLRVGTAIAALAALGSLVGLGVYGLRRTAAPPAPVAVVASPAPPAPAAAAAAATRAPVVPVAVKLELDSSPRGAAVTGATGEALGTTPVTITLPRGDRPRAFTIAKGGYMSVIYEATPTRDAVAVIELQRDHAPASRRARKVSSAGHDLGDGMTINPF